LCWHKYLLFKCSLTLSVQSKHYCFSKSSTYLSRAEKTFILSGIELPSPAADPLERQKQLKLAVTNTLTKLDPALASHNIVYVRVVKSPKPSILEVECENIERFARSSFLRTNKLEPLLMPLQEDNPGQEYYGV
jgi:hypothetical protein